MNYENILLNDKTKEGMSLTIDDQKWLKLLFDRQDEVTHKYISDTYDKHAKLITDTVRELLNDFKKEINIELKELRIEIKDVRTEIKLLHVIAEKNQIDIREINGCIQQMKKDITEHEFRIQHIEKKLDI